MNENDKIIIKQYDNYKKMIENIGRNPIILEEYKNRLKELYKNDLNFSVKYTDDDYLNDCEYSNLINSNIDDIEEIETDRLKKILNSEYYEVYSVEYHDQAEFLKEDIFHIFNIDSKEYDRYFKVGGYYDSVLYFNFESSSYSVDNDLTDIENYSDFLDSFDFLGFNMYLVISLSDLLQGYKVTDLDSDYAKLKDLVKIEFFNRIKTIKKDIKKVSDDINKLSNFINDSETIEKLKPIFEKHEVLNYAIIEHKENLKLKLETLQKDLNFLMED